MPRKHAVRGAKLNTRQKRQVKRLIGNRTEDKIHDNVFAAASVDAGGSIGYFTQPPQTVGGSGRTGDELHLKKLMFNFTWQCADSTNVCRLLVFRWNDNNAVAVPTVADVVTTGGPLAMWNDTNIENGRIKILYDKTVALSLNGTASFVRKASVFGTKLGKKKLVFNPALTTGMDQIYYMVVSDSVAASHPQFFMTSRQVYTDA